MRWVSVSPFCQRVPPEGPSERGPGPPTKAWKAKGTSRCTSNPIRAYTRSEWVWAEHQETTAVIIKTGLLAGAFQVRCLRSLHVCLKQKDTVFPNFPTLSSYYLLDSFLKMGSLAPCRSRRLRQKERPPTPRQGKDQLYFLRSTQTATPQTP